MNGADYFMRRRDNGKFSPPRERFRFALLFLATIAAVVVFAVLSEDSPGRAFQVAGGMWVAAYGVVDLGFLATGDIERIWTKTKRDSLMVATILTILGAGMLMLGLSS